MPLHIAGLVFPLVAASSTSSALGPYPPWGPSTYQPPPFGYPLAPQITYVMLKLPQTCSSSLWPLTPSPFSSTTTQTSSPEILPPKSYRSHLSSSLLAFIIPYQDYNINLLTGLPAPSARVSGLFNPFSILMPEWSLYNIFLLKFSQYLTITSWLNSTGSKPCCFLQTYLLLFYQKISTLYVRALFTYLCAS